MITAHSATCRQLLAVSCNCRLMVLIKAVGAAAEEGLVPQLRKGWCRS